MIDQPMPIIPPAPDVPARDLPGWRQVLAAQHNSITIFPEYCFDVAFARRKLLGVKALLVNEPDSIRHVLVTGAANYVRPKIVSRVLRPLLGRGIFLAEGSEWRGQRRMVAPVFTPQNVGLLLPHFFAAAEDLLRRLQRNSKADLSSGFQDAALEAVLRALFSMPDSVHRAKLAGMVRSYIHGPGKTRVWDLLARDEASFSFASGKRRRFQAQWFAAVDAVIRERRASPQAAGHRDLLDLLLAATNPATGEALSDAEVRDQCATLIFGGFETTARLLFWAVYLLTLDPGEQERLRREISNFPPERVSKPSDLDHWPRLRMVLLETLRLYPPVPHIVREAIYGDAIESEPVAQGTQIWISPWVTHRHRRFWEQPLAFKPDRFAGKASAWTAFGAYLPFGAGGRVCMGASFALSEAQIMIATLLQRYRLTCEEKRPVLPVARFTIEPSFSPAFHLEPLSQA